MKHSSLSSLPALTLLLGTLTLVGLVGCGGALNIPDSVASSEAAGPAVGGSMFGGHAPITGAHVYLLQPSITAYGGLATSILGNNGATSANGFAITANVNDPNVPVGANYETTDSGGNFSFTGAYNCKVGQPVYIYGYGGNIGATANSTTTTTTTTVPLGISAATATGTGFTYTFTFTVTGTPATALAVGDTVNLTLANDPNTANRRDPSNAGTGWTMLHTAMVTSVNFATHQFTATGTTQTTNGATGTGSYTFTTNTTTTTTNPAINNNSIVEFLTLGNCPSSGNFSSGSTPIQFVYLNEVSTVATAYTFQPFTLLTNNDAWHIGTPGTTQAMLGIANAATTASQLYNIQGASTNISTSDDGEGHLANTLTAAGNGIVPQATIDSLANIVANCVDSVPATVGTPTAQCSALFAVATEDGTTTGTPPVDTGTAVINIARFPAGNNSSNNVNTTYASTLFALQGTGTVPYVPDLHATPNDWTIAINYPAAAITGFPFAANPAFGLAESIEVDGNGDIWVTGQTDFSIVRLDSQGVIFPATAENDLGYIPGYVSVDGNNNAWTGNANTTSPIFEAGANGVFTATFGTANQFGKAYVNIADNAGDDFFFASTTAVGGTGGTGGNFEMFEYPAGSTTTTVPTESSISPSTFPAGDNIAHGALDANGDFWLTTETSFQIAKVTNAGAKVWSKTVGQQPEFVAIDNNGTGWIPGYEADEVYQITSGGTSTTLTSGSTGAALVFPFGSAVDGNGNVWITNRCGPNNDCGTAAHSRTLVEINGTGTTTPGTINTAISPGTNYLPEAQYPATATAFTAILQDPLNIAIDPSGNIWITNYNSGGVSSVTEIVGTAAPVFTPLSAAAGATPSKLGAKP
jgi:hypothetical protein